MILPTSASFPDKVFAFFDILRVDRAPTRSPMSISVGSGSISCPNDEWAGASWTLDPGSHRKVGGDTLSI
jgi:hypothetical protein